MIENRNLEVGTRLVASYKKQTYVCTVEAAEDGEGVVYKLEDGKSFKSPSAAGSAVMGGKAVNGWRFWSLEGEATASQASAATKATRGLTEADSASKQVKPKRRAAKSKPAYKVIRPMDNQEDVPEGQVRYWCDACMDAFLGFADAAPEQCPNGHRLDDPELNGDAGISAEVTDIREREDGTTVYEIAEVTC